MVESTMTTLIFCVCGAIFALLLRQYSREQSMMTSLITCIGVMGAFIGLAEPFIREVEELFFSTGISSDYIALIFKATAVCIITQITSELCRDSGENAIASVAELWGRGLLLTMSLPVTKALLELINNFL